MSIKLLTVVSLVALPLQTCWTGQYDDDGKKDNVTGDDLISVFVENPGAVFGPREDTPNRTPRTIIEDKGTILVGNTRFPVRTRQVIRPSGRNTGPTYQVRVNGQWETCGYKNNSRDECSNTARIFAGRVREDGDGGHSH